MNIGILGAGTWGLALAALLCKNGHAVTVWSHRAESADRLRATRTHPHLPDVVLPDRIVRPEHDSADHEYADQAQHR